MAAADEQIRASLVHWAPRINEVVDKFDAQDENSAESQSKKSAADKLMLDLHGAGLAYYRRLAPKCAGPHEENRSTFGVDSYDVHCLLHEILQQGWSWGEVHSAWAFEVWPGQAGQDQLAFQQKLYDNSGQTLPLMQATDFTVRTVARTHTNMTLRVATTACKTHVDELANDDGRLSFELCVGMNDAFQEPCEMGLNWLVVRWQAVRFQSMCSHATWVVMVPGRGSKSQAHGMLISRKPSAVIPSWI